LIDAGKVYEEPGTHVHFGRLGILWICRLKALTKKVAIFQEATPSNLFWFPGRNQFVVQVIESLLKVSVDTFTNNRWIKVFRNVGPLATLVKYEQSVKPDMKRVDREFILSSHGVHKLQLYRSHPGNIENIVKDFGY
jgi:hypothetical protein